MSRRLTLALAILIALPLTTGCGRVKEDHKRIALESTLSGYRQSIRWGYFPAAAAVLSPETRGTVDMDALENVRVTAYEVVQPAMQSAENEAVQLVQIEYVLKDRQRVERLADRQRWRYDDDKRAWWLESGLPAFKGTSRPLSP
jgi:hypothetical protein